MDIWLQSVLTVLGSVLASSGLWAFLTKKAERKDTKTDMLIGLAHDRIMSLGMFYIERGWITADEYENLRDYRAAIDDRQFAVHHHQTVFRGRVADVFGV